MIGNRKRYHIRISFNNDPPMGKVLEALTSRPTKVGKTFVEFIFENPFIEEQQVRELCQAHIKRMKESGLKAELHVEETLPEVKF